MEHMTPDTLCSRRRLYLLARVVVARHYRRELTLAAVAQALATSPRELQRAFAQCGETTFSEQLTARRLKVGAQLLVEQRWITVEDVARLVGYSEGTHFARAFRRRYGLSPARFRRAALQAQASQARASQAGASQAGASNARAARAGASQARASQAQASRAGASQARARS
jgi:AraC family transcriptional regulator, regulatory protein of adaptative response / methylphosphotriester-DNA alkyltransferase methyltransferase